MNELKSLEHATLKVPYEVFNKRYRNAQRVMDVEARAVGAVAGELDGAARAPTPTPTPTPAAGEITELLGGMVEKLTAMKRKASESINEELQAALVCKKRLEHLKEQAVTLTEPSTPQVRTSTTQWRRIRLERMLVDYFLRSGYYDAAAKLADARDLRSLTNVDIYCAAAEVEAELRARRTARVLQWCADNKSKLRKLNSTIEFKIRLQEFIELVRADRRLEAVKYAKKHLSQYEDGQLEDIQHCMGMLAFPNDTEVEPYASLLARGRWAALERQFRAEHARLLHPAPLPALPVALQLGLHALNTPQCYNAATQVAACPACAAPLNQLARTLPHAHVSHSRLVCRLSRAPLNEHNQPMALPNGQVYGEQALKEMMNEHGSIVCPKTNEVFCMKRVEKVYVM
ncbi:E3 ubiquitin-protein transferase Katazuke [Choristoneura fumiferana]|uniref:E3 ubiquitin-protein transferase Katazuke n=1 Tax=Choristoneura fumiferana TaxID=7141 RepID=UPI003D153F8C